MHSIRQCTSELDFDTFISLQFEATKENNGVDTSMPLDEQLRAHRTELLKFLESKQKTGIFFAVDDDHQPLGYVWVSERGYLDPWDFQPEPAWVYDLRVDSQRHGQGLGQALMQQAEAWAIQEGFKRIGLHVFGENQPAIRLYAKLGYVALNSQVKKNINNLPSTPVPGNGRYVVHPFAREADPAPLIDLWKASFSNAAQSLCHVPGEQIQERFEAFIKDIHFDHPELETFIIRDQNDALSGFVRLKAVDHNGQKYAQINTIQITQEPDNAVGVLLKTIEQWALQRSISCIVTGKISEDNLLACFHQAGYTNSNLYMFKSLSERTN
jgi:ribosomal protein S18 acetylase RimI-like enzyme